MGEFLTDKKQRNIATRLKLLDMTVRTLMVRLGVDKVEIEANEYLLVQRRVTHYDLQEDFSIHVTLAKDVEDEPPTATHSSGV